MQNLFNKERGWISLKTCKECGSCVLVSTDKYMCIGVKEPFIIENINNECTEYKEPQIKKEQKPTWRDVMDCKVWFGDAYNMFATARNYGYKYFVWNDRVYKILDDVRYHDTGYLVKDM